MFDVLKVLDWYGLLEKASPGQMQVSVLCPFHEDKDSMSLIAYIEGRDFHCFGCGFHGDSVDFVKRIEEIDNDLEALTIIVSKIHANSDFDYGEQPDTSHELKASRRFFQSLDKPDWEAYRLIQGDFRKPMRYMVRRGFKLRTVQHFDVRINIASTYPLVIPMFEDGGYTGYIARRITDGEPKYKYNHNFSKRSALIGELQFGPVMVVEGIMDYMKVWQHGFRNVALLNGWSCSNIQAQKLLEHATVIINALDNDIAGEQGGVKLEKTFAKKGLEVIRFPIPSHRKDIGEMTKDEFLYALQHIETRL